MQPEIIYENADFVAVNKPVGWLTHHTAQEYGEDVSQEKTLTAWLTARYPEMNQVGDDPKNRPGIVHRLDRTTSGIMLAARTAAGFEYLKNLFAKHEVEKTYLALAIGKFKETKGQIDLPIGMTAGTLKRSVHATKMLKAALTAYKVLAYDPAKNISLVELRPQTGRTHQLRVHLASLGRPILGDQVYGPKKQTPKVPRIMLHALALSFTSPDGARLRLTAPLPEDFKVHLPPEFYPHISEAM